MSKISASTRCSRASTTFATLLLATFFSTPVRAETPVACLAEAVYYEARGKGAEARAAVAHVVLNRAEHRDFPDDPCAVVADGCQFSYRCDGRPERLAERPEREAAFRTAAAVLDGALPDPTGGALFFHAAGVAPGWFATRPRAATIGGNVFYR